jgi:Domain of unknown function (DUF4157)
MTTACLQNAAKTSVPGVMTFGGPFLQRKCACGGSAGVIGECDGCQSQKLSLQRSRRDSEVESENSFGGPPIVHEVLRSSGQPLDTKTQSFMEARFGHDFSRVRVHTDSQAEESASAVSAHAYTVGEDIAFARDQYAPQTIEGKRLLAHELTHVVQQTGNVMSSGDLHLSSPEDPAEQAADRIANVVMTDRVVDLRGIVGSAQRSATRLVQRTATNTGEAPKPIVNPAQQIGANVIKAEDLFLGKTDFFLNSTMLTGSSPDIVRKAINEPTIASAETTIPVGDGSKTIKGSECWFDSVPDNKGVIETQVLSESNWTYVADKPNLAKRFSSLKACDVGSGKSTFVVRGEPDDDTLRNRIKKHEKTHGDDDEEAFKDFLKAWDAKVTQRHKDKYKAKAPTISICEASLYSGSQKPGDLAVAMATQMDTKAKGFHNTAEGSKPTTKPEKPDSDCNVVKAKTGYDD